MTEQPLPEDLGGPRAGWTFLLTVGALVVISVLLALSIDELRRNASARAPVANMQERIFQEVAANHNELVRTLASIERQHLRLEELASSLSTPQSLFALMEGAETDPSLPDLREVVWTRVRQDPLSSKIDADFLEGAIELYLWKPKLDELSGRIVSIMVGGMGHDPAKLRTGYTALLAAQFRQIRWCRDAIDTHRLFLNRYGPLLGNMEIPER